jgi:hypothetical protein
MMIPIVTRRALLLAMPLMTLASCSTPDAVPGSLEGRWTAEVDTIADTIAIRTIGGSEWGAVRLVEELRIGAVDSADHLMFGQVTALAVRKNGEILVFDGQAPALRRFGADGAYLGTISREGAGPGEYRSGVALAVLPDDRLVAHDFLNSRFNVYSADTTFLTSWLLPTQGAEWRPIPTHDGGSVYLFDYARAEGASEREYLVRLDERGTPGDTTFIRLPERQTPFLEIKTERGSHGSYVPFHATPEWSVTPAGELVMVDGVRYAIDTYRRNGKVQRLTRVTSEVPVSAEERAAEEARITAGFRRTAPTWSWDGPPMPATKPPITWLHTAQDGAIWVRVPRAGSALPQDQQVRSARSWVREPMVFDVFAPDGRYRGEVHAPDGILLMPHPVLGAEKVWAVVRDADGVNFVARFRIERD